MIRIVLIYGFILVCCLFVSNLSAVASGSEPEGPDGMAASVTSDDWRVLFNHSQEFYDVHKVEIAVFAAPVYDGMYVGNCYVTGDGKRDEKSLGKGGDNFYLGGAADDIEARLTFRDHPNVDLDGDGWGWCKINGSTDDLQYNEAEDSEGFTFDPADGDNTPDCPGCDDANPDCPHAGNRHMDPPAGDFDEIFNELEEESLPGLRPANGSPDPHVSPGGTHNAELVTSEPYYYIRWYIASPNDCGLGTLVETDEGWSTGTETEASLSYTFASDAVSGDWTITAVSERYSDLSQGSTRSYTVTVE